MQIVATEKFVTIGEYLISLQVNIEIAFGWFELTAELPTEFNVNRLNIIKLSCIKNCYNSYTNFMVVPIRLAFD